jgi:hypothetical protein
MAPWARRAFAWYVVVIATGLLLAWAERSSMRQIFHELRVQSSTGVAQPGLNRSVGRTDLLSVANLVVIAPFYVLLLMWQYRAAKTARLLDLPAAHSPGLGVGSWFIPVVNFWFPYQALRDCLPPGDPDRRAVHRMWTCFISLIILNLITEVLLWTGNGAGLVFSIIAVALGVGFAAYGIRTVRAITSAHRRLLGLG